MWRVQKCFANTVPNLYRSYMRNGRRSEYSTFLAMLKQFPILLNKSQIPSIKEEKVNALQTTCIKLEEILGRKFTPQQVQKKIQNMKTELKRKTDRKATGNQKLRLKRWEEEFLQLLDGESNPTIGRIPGTHIVAPYMEESNFHPENTKKKGKKHRVTAPQYGIVNIDGLRDDYPHVSRQEQPPPWWSVNIENMYRCQMAGYRDEKHYLMKRRLKTVEKWPETELIKKLVRWDGLHYYFSKYRDCPDLKTDDIKRAFLREPIIFENTAFRDKDLEWAPIITEQAQRFNDACDEILRTFRKPKKARKVKSEAGPSKANRAQEEKSVTFGIKDKYLLPEEDILTEKKKNKDKIVEKSKRPKENRKKSVKNKNSASQYATGDGIPSKKGSVNHSKENVTQNVEAPAQYRAERTKPSEKRDVHSAKLAPNKKDRFKSCGKSLSVSDFVRSECQIGELPLKKKKSSIKPSTSAVLKSKKDSELSPIPVSARVAAKK